MVERQIAKPAKPRPMIMIIILIDNTRIIILIQIVLICYNDNRLSNTNNTNNNDTDTIIMMILNMIMIMLIRISTHYISWAVTLIPTPLPPKVLQTLLGISCNKRCGHTQDNTLYYNPRHYTITPCAKL